MSHRCRSIWSGGGLVGPLSRRRVKYALVSHGKVSHMNEKPVEERVAHSCEVHLSPDELFIGIHATNDSKVLRSIIFACSSRVFVEGDVDSPTATTPLGPERPIAHRQREAPKGTSSAGSSKRDTRPKRSWLGSPCCKSTISPSSAAFTSPKSAISTQLFLSA
jgi:hypothetical protein